MKQKITMSAGSIIGRLHKEKNKNNQDAFHALQTDEYTIAIITDGCSGSTRVGTQDEEVKNSEVGSHLGALMMTKTIEKHLRQFEQVFDKSSYLQQSVFWQQVHADMIAQLRVMGNSLHDNLRLVMKNYFLFTIVGVIITKHKTCIFSLGDGWYALNGTTYTIEPPEGMKQPYIAYGITGFNPNEISYQSLQFTIQQCIETKDLEHCAIGSDGVNDLELLESTTVPGKKSIVGPISQFWTDPVYLTNKAWLQNKLNTFNTSKQKINWLGRSVDKYNGLLPDDTTLIVLRHLQN